MSKKMILSGMMAVVLVVAIIAMIAVVSRSSNASRGKSTFSTSKSIQGFCATTDFSDLCEYRLTAAVNESASPQEIVQASFKVAIAEIQSALNRSAHVAKKATGGMDQMALEDCRKLLMDSNEDFEEMFQYTHNLKELVNHIDEVKAYLTAVIAYFTTCVDGIPQEDLRVEMDNALVNATQLTSNSIAIVKHIALLLKKLDIDIDSESTTESGHSRRLLYDRDENGYPRWLTAGDRKLLEEQSNLTTTPNAVVAQDGSGDFKSIQEAVEAMPQKRQGWYVIYVKAGLYQEYVNITRDKKKLFMYGDGWDKTVVTGSRNYLVANITTINTPTITAAGNEFICKGMRIINTAGPEKGQAVALRVAADKSIIYNCRIDGYQDTLYAHGKRQFYSMCTISGTVDFIFGYAAAVFQDCLILPRRPLDGQANEITAHGRNDAQQDCGYVIHNCRIEPDNDLVAERFDIATYLGRPWKPYATVVVIESTIGDLVRPTGWSPWDGVRGTMNTQDCFYAEYDNNGPGANITGRVTWKGYHIISKETAAAYMVDRFIQGNEWIPLASVSYLPSFKNEVV